MYKGQPQCYCIKPEGRIQLIYKRSSSFDNVMTIQGRANCNPSLLRCLSGFSIFWYLPLTWNIFFYLFSSSKSQPDDTRIVFLAWEFVTRGCLKPQNPHSNHEIHVLFEHGFYLKMPELGPDLHARRYTGKRCDRYWSFRLCFRSRKRCTRKYDVVVT